MAVEIRVKVKIYDHKKFCNGRQRACKFLDNGSSCCTLFDIENEMDLKNELVKKNQRCLDHYENKRT